MVAGTDTKGADKAKHAEDPQVFLIKAFIDCMIEIDMANSRTQLTMTAILAKESLERLLACESVEELRDTLHSESASWSKDGHRERIVPMGGYEITPLTAHMPEVFTLKKNTDETDGMVQFEYIELRHDKAEGSTSEGLRRADTDKDGILSLEELKNELKILGQEWQAAENLERTCKHCSDFCGEVHDMPLRTYLCLRRLFQSPHVSAGNINTPSEVSRLLERVARVDRLPQTNSLEILHTLRDAW